MPPKKQKIDGHQSDAVVAVGDEFTASFDGLSVDVHANIFSFLQLKDSMRSRRVNKKSREAVKKTIIPPADFFVDSVSNYNAMGVMTRAMPNLQQIRICYPGGPHKWSDGEDPDEEWADETADRTPYDIGIISNFSNLRILELYRADLNGRYPVFFNFPLLQKLCLTYCHRLKWDLEMLAGLPLLKELQCKGNHRLTGNISSLRVLKNTLEKVEIQQCRSVVGNFMDLADFPHLKELDLFGTAVTGDIREISDNNFSALESLCLPHGVYGGHSYEFQRISDAPDLVRSLYLFKKQRPSLKMKMKDNWCGVLSEDSPDWYPSADDHGETPPFIIRLVKAGSRIGYRWITWAGRPCEVNWLDPEPDRESSDYDKYIEELEEIESQVTIYRGFSHRPPTEEEYHRLIEALPEESDSERTLSPPEVFGSEFDADTLPPPSP